MTTILKIVCMYCRSGMGEKDGQGVSGVSHSICRSCWEEHYPQWDYPAKEDTGIINEREEQ